MKSFNRKEILSCMIDLLEKSKSKKDYILIKTSIFEEYQNELNYRYILKFNELCSELKSDEVIEVNYNKYNSSLINTIQLYINKSSILYKELGRESVERKLVILNKIFSNFSNTKSMTIKLFVKFLKTRVDKSQSIKMYCDIDNLTEFEMIITAISRLEELEEETLKRNFSARYLNDSKVFESIENKVCRIIRDFNINFKFMSNEEVLSRLNLVKYPSQIVLKGNCEILYGNHQITLEKLGVIHIEDSLVELINKIECNKVITIENKATFYEYNPREELVIYTGGFPNKLVVKFINLIINFNNDANIRHFSDIDLGGFLILKYLRESINAQIESYNMSKNTLIKYLKYCKKGLSQNSIIRLKELSNLETFTSVEQICIRYVIENEIWLEQENIMLNRS